MSRLFIVYNVVCLAQREKCSSQLTHLKQNRSLQRTDYGKKCFLQRTPNVAFEFPY